ncbi:unnamed protein product [Fraxinus pennsylvanica]|uniref:BED-type domain-containing protein n=1 Tax=Fraxinus pennsylvanica TaxID=56036 RepID=A0AAD1Z814_9LAMI|nr:unnamed protein product [Fraxinus pennsylvanica]
MDIYVTLLFFVAVTCYLLWFTFISKSLKGPRVWPVLGSLPGLIENSEQMHEWIVDNLRACSGTYQTCICAIPFLARKQGLVTVTCDPKNLEHILKTRFDNYPKGPTWQAVFHDLLGHGIFNSDGDTWLVQRKTAALEFTTRTLRQAMGRWVNRAIKNRFCPILKTAQLEVKPVDLQDLLLRLTFDNICGLAFGKDPETLAPEMPDNSFASAFDRATEASLQRFIFPEVVWKLKKLLRLGMEVSLSRSLVNVDKYLSSIIKTRKLELMNKQKDANPHDDLLSRFMKKKESYSDKFLQQVALNFILAGRDTSSVALSWFFWLVMQNPRVEEKILREICTVLIDTRGIDIESWVDDPLVYEEVNRLVYLKAELSETLRLYPSVPEDSKHVVADDTLPDGTFVPVGSSVTYSIYSAGRMKSTQGLGLLTNEVDSGSSAASLQADDGGRSQSGAKDIIDIVHEVWPQIHPPFFWPASSDIRMGKNNRTDPAWKYGKEIEKTGGDKKSYVYIECMFCQKAITGGVKRMKEHLACTHKNVAPCPGVPAEVKQEIAEYMNAGNMKRQLSQQQFEDMVELGSYYEKNDTEKDSSRGIRGPMDRFVSNIGAKLTFTKRSPVAWWTQFGFGTPELTKKKTVSRKGKETVTLQLVDEEDDFVEIESSEEEDDEEIRYDDDSVNNASNSDDSGDF